MRRLILLPARRLWAIFAAVCLVALGAGIAQAALRSGGSPPPAKPLDRALRAAATAPAAPGITARIQFANHLLPSGSVGGQTAGSPLLQGATGRLWASRDGRFRLELQSDSGDAQIVSDGRRLSVYDASSNTVYRATLPQQHPGAHDHGAPTLKAIDSALSGLSRTWTLSGARPGTTAGQPSYTLRVKPKDDGGLLGAAEVAWDAAHGTPLRAAVYAQGQSAPVVELEATKISFDAVPASDLRVSPPANAKVVQIDPGQKLSHRPHRIQPSVRGARAVAGRLPFALSAPRQLAGLPRRDVRLVSFGSERAALVTYGRGLGAIAVIERHADGGRAPGSLGQLPSVNIDGATGKELATALGTVVTFQRGGVAYLVAGSVPPVAAENAARGLR